MEELHIYCVALNNGDYENDLCFAGTKDELMDSLNENEFTEFYTLNDAGHMSDVIIRSDEISMVEIDTSGEIAREIDNVKHDDAKVVDITSLLKKIEKTDLSSLRMCHAQDPQSIMQEIDCKQWLYAKLEPTGKALIDMLTSVYPNSDYKVRKIFSKFIYIAMDATEAIKIFLSACNSSQSDEVIAEHVSDAIKTWIKAMAFDDEVILNTVANAKHRDSILDNVFTTALDSIEREIEAH